MVAALARVGSAQATTGEAVAYARALAAKNKCLAERDKTRAGAKATNRRLHPGQHPPVVRMRTRDRVSSLPRWRGPTSQSTEAAGRVAWGSPRPARPCHPLEEVESPKRWPAHLTALTSSR